MKIQTLQPHHLAQVLTLQQFIEDNLKATEKKFILHRNASEYLTYLKKGQMLGIFNDTGNLIAQMIYKLPDTAHRDYMEFLPDIASDKMVIYEAIAVHPAYRKHQLMMHMLNHIEKNTGRQIAIIQIAADNPASWLNAMRYGMHIAKADYDPDDKTPVYYLVKQLHTPQKENTLNHHRFPILQLDKSRPLNPSDLQSLFHIVKHSTGHYQTDYTLSDNKITINRIQSEQQSKTLPLTANCLWQHLRLVNT